MLIYLTNIAGKSFNPQNIGLLSQRGQKNYARLINQAPQKALQTAVADLIIKKVLNVSDENFIIEETASGAPFVKDKAEFSVSHSENVVAVAVDEKPLGADVQIIKEPLSQNLINGTLNNAELATFNSIEKQSDKVKYFYRCLTEKESYVKFLKTGFTCLPRDIKNYNGAKFVTKYVFQSGEVYCLTVCAENITAIRYEVIPFETLF